MKLNSPTSTPAGRKAGFSLFEMLTFVAILGIMVTMAVPVFGNSQGARQAKDQRNAQNLCSLANAANAAGFNVTTGAGDDVTKPVKLLVDGITITKGPLKNRTFKVPNMSFEDMAGAAQYLEIKNGDLAYSPEAFVR